MTTTSYTPKTHQINPSDVPRLAEPGVVRKATSDDAPELARVLARAFEADPVTAWFFPNESERRERMERLFGLISLPKMALPHDETYTTDARAGAALWQPPGTFETGIVESVMLLPRLARVCGRGLPRGLRGLSFMESTHPHEPHWYLPFLGVDPEWQGHGIGTALLGPVLERCDREAMPAYLEATTPRNRELYRRNGFEVIEEIRFPDDGPAALEDVARERKAVMPYVSINDVELYYEVTGAGEPLVLVHGGWGDHHNWDAVAPALAESFRVVTYDRRGHSQSERPATQGSRREDEDDLAALVEALDCAPAHLVGNSWGASTVIGLATRRPELVRSVTAHEPPLMSLAVGDPHVEPLLQEAQATIQRVLEELQQGDIEGGTRRFIEQVALGPGAWDQLPLELREISMNNAPTFVDDMGDPDWADIDLSDLARLSVPVLMTQGDQSPPWFLGIVAELARVVGHAEVGTFAGAGHAPHLTNPGDYVNAVTDFLVGQRELTAALP